MKGQSSSKIICLLHTVLGTRYMYLKKNRWRHVNRQVKSLHVVSADLSASHANDEWMSLWNGTK